MYYIKINSEDGNSLIYYCRFCGHEDNEPAENGVVVLRTEYKKSEQQFSHMINRYIKYDNTLPRITNMKCPNENCNKQGDHKQEPPTDPSVIYLRYDENNMKYLYICENCNTTWKTDDNK
jgi:DNA-directed RNA polymerase subunit M/transcription elongation factor TFIIS